MRRLVSIALSISLVLALSATGRLLAQDEKKDAPKAEAPKESPKKDEAKPAEPKNEAAPKEEPKKEAAAKAEPKSEAPKEEAKKGGAPAAAAPAEEPLPTIPPEVQAKLEAARRAVAEAIVAAQDAGLVETTMDLPPILDILITGRALDMRAVKKAVGQTDLQVGVNPEVFGAWFTGHANMAGVVAQKNVRIVEPSKGLKDWYDQRDAMLRPHIDAVRKAKGTPAPKAEETKKDAAKSEPPKAEEPKGEPKKDAPKAEAPKSELRKEAAKDQPKAP